MPSDEHTPTAAEFVRMFQRSAQRVGARVDSTRSGVVVTSGGLTQYEETPPSFHDPAWASWWAYRVLPHADQRRFHKRMSALYAEYRESRRKWVTYNHEKRLLLKELLSWH